MIVKHVQILGEGFGGALQLGFQKVELGFVLLQVFCVLLGLLLEFCGCRALLCSELVLLLG
jgi:hypothetical protein